jgi:hypothetical protein
MTLSMDTCPLKPFEVYVEYKKRNSKAFEIRLSWWPERIESLDKGKEFCDV